MEVAGRLTFGEFTRACQKEWHSGRGDVIGLELRESSFAELCADMVSQPQAIAKAWWYHGTEDGSSMTFAKTVNPVTRSRVTVTGTAQFDVIIVRKPPAMLEEKGDVE